ncbi:MAG: tRNA (adenosine(37)-N6)-threonylcarbamoyltransferase complex dimerization subunit type 1 TsaB [Chloroflexi bacterium]|nr:tRNA (adenosine(37)-N6)-threonylcarbamoyltransferase complex dimerization subunit type 1 TsaB [Chloroflexota bacterium]
MELTIDTSQAVLCLALARQGDVLAEYTWRAQHGATAEVVPVAQYLLAQAGADLKQLTGLVVTKGPGSYNGLRAGVATAKGLAFSLEIPLVAVGTLEAMAYQYAFLPWPVCPLLEVGRGEVAAALYYTRRSKWTQLVAEHITVIEGLPLPPSGPIFCCGTLSPATVSRLKGVLGRRGVIAAGAAAWPRAAPLALLGWQRLAQGQTEDLATLQPLYLRHPVITQPKQPFSQSPSLL